MNGKHLGLAALVIAAMPMVAMAIAMRPARIEPGIALRVATCIFTSPLQALELVERAAWIGGPGDSDIDPRIDMQGVARLA